MLSSAPDHHTDAFIYQADIYCRDCGMDIQAGLSALPELERTDSDKYPQGPYPYGGGEADTPQNCRRCGLFLQNPLTGDGYDYVREHAAEFKHDHGAVRGDESWEDVARHAESAGSDVVAEWIRFYLARDNNARAEESVNHLRT